MENKSDFDIELITRCLSGKASEQDRQLLLKWIAISDKNESLYFTMKDLFEAGAWDKLKKEANTNEEWLKLSSKMNKKILSVEKPSKFMFHYKYALKYAAILIFGIFSTLLIQKIIKFSGNQSEIAWQTIVAKYGTQTDFELPDGSHVWLNSGSIIQFPIAFAKNIREVKLKGEAFFNVSHDVNHPFIVNTGKMNVEVLGTTFNVANYANDNTMEVELATGKVNLFTGNWVNKNIIGRMNPGQRAVYDPKGNSISISNVEISKYLAWKDGFLMFSGDPMDEVVKKLNRWFNVEFIIQDSILTEYEYKATFREESLVQVLELLKLSSPIDYKIQKGNKLKNNEYSKPIVYLKLKK